MVSLEVPPGIDRLIIRIIYKTHDIDAIVFDLRIYKSMANKNAVTRIGLRDGLSWKIEMFNDLVKWIIMICFIPSGEWIWRCPGRSCQHAIGRNWRTFCTPGVLVYYSFVIPVEL